MIKEISTAVASWISAYQDQDIMKLIDFCRERIENKKRGDITNDISTHRFIYDSRLQTEVMFTNWKTREKYLRWIERRKNGSYHLTYEQWLKSR